jgi:hypothetical protein
MRMDNNRQRPQAGNQSGKNSPNVFHDEYEEKEMGMDRSSWFLDEDWDDDDDDDDD